VHGASRALAGEQGPVPGRIHQIVARKIQPAAGAPLVEIGDARNLEVIVDVLTADAVAIKPGAEVRLPTPREYNTALLVLNGTVKANDSAAVSAGEFILFKNDGDEIRVTAVTDAIVLFLSGEPIEEPLVHYGPFIMNSVDEINQAVEDFQAGRFGHLEG